MRWEESGVYEGRCARQGGWELVRGEYEGRAEEFEGGEPQERECVAVFACEGRGAGEGRKGAGAVDGEGCWSG